MPSHFFQPMPHSIHLVLGFDLALYSWSRDLHPLDCVHAAHTKKPLPVRRGLLSFRQILFKRARLRASQEPQSQGGSEPERYRP